MIATCIIQIPVIHSSDAYPWLTAFQILRFHRVITDFPVTSRIVNKALLAVNDALSVALLTLITYFCFAVIFNQLIGTQYYEQYDQFLASNGTVVPATLPYMTTATFLDAFITAFTIWVSDGWDGIVLGFMGTQLYNFQDTFPGYAYFVIGATALIVASSYAIFNCKFPPSSPTTAPSQGI